MRAELKVSHIDFNDMKKGLFTSDYEKSFQRPKGKAAKLDKQRVQDIKASHFTMGQSDLNYLSNQKRDYVPLNAKSA